MTAKEIQIRLKELGYKVGTIDGIIGPNTKREIRAFQRMHGLVDDGIVGPKTLEALKPDTIPQREKPLKTPIVWPRQADVVKFYGPVGSNQTSLVLPFKMKIAWDPKVTISKFSIHEKVHDSAKRCFERIADRYDDTERASLGLDLFGGCLNVRKMRGGSAYSMHSWGIAIDFDPARNQLKWGMDRARLAKDDCKDFWRIWEEEGWVSLGRSRNYDWMHVQAARL